MNSETTELHGPPLAINQRISESYSPPHSANETTNNTNLVKNMRYLTSGPISEISNMWIRVHHPSASSESNRPSSRTAMASSDISSRTISSQRGVGGSWKNTVVRRWSRRKCDFCILLVAFAALLSACHAAPRPLHHHSRRHQPDMNHEMLPKWRFPCNAGYEATTPAAGSSSVPEYPFSRPIVSEFHTKTKTTRNPCAKRRNKLEPLLKAVSLVISKAELQQAINTTYIEEWYPKKERSYKFLKGFGQNDTRVRLRQWHHSTQIYVGAFQTLYRMQQTYDAKHNPHNYNITENLHTLTISSSNFLCDIESRMRTLNFQPVYLTTEEMNKTVNFWKEPTELRFHLQFAKKRFMQFLKGMQKVLKVKLDQLNRRPRCKPRGGVSSGIASKATGNGMKKHKKQLQQQQQKQRNTNEIPKYVKSPSVPKMTAEKRQRKMMERKQHKTRHSSTNELAKA